MNRFLALIGALVLAFVTVSSACIAAPSEWIHFTLEPQRGSDLIHASFRNQTRGGENNWSSGFRASELAGLDAAGFRGAGNRPLRFALIREAGRLDCSGNGGNSRAAGNCSFTADQGFTQLLERRGIGRPTQEQGFGLMAVNVRRELIEAIAAARYPTPTIENLIALSALGADGRYISGMARAGYRPRTLDTLVQFKALNITAEWIAGFARIGYADVPGDELVQLRALNVTPEFITGFDRAGFRHLPVEKLVQLKALGIGPDLARKVAGDSAQLPGIDKLMQARMFGSRR
jgi:hypothetical protein